MKLKFRGKSKSTGQWIYGMYVPDKFTGKAWIINDKRPGKALRDLMEEIHPNTIGLYSNYDVNGVEIYAGDIISAKLCSAPTWTIYFDIKKHSLGEEDVRSKMNAYMIEKRFPVGFYRGCFGVKVTENTLKYAKGDFLSLSKLGHDLYVDNVEPMKVIGNVVDNAILLAGKY